jgi:phage tail tape-measure protein
MALKVRGITIEIGGDTTGLEKSLKNVNKSIYDTQSELKDVERLLKIDPKNTELLAQKQKLLTQAIADTQDKLKTLREAEEKAQEAFRKGEMSQAAYNALKREIVATEQSERNLQTSLDNTNKALNEQGNAMDKGVLKAELMRDAVKKIADVLIKMGKEAINYNAKMESFTATFASFLGSTEAAEKALAQLKQDASTMPFGVSELVEANQALITTGATADEARENINALAAAVAATGGGSAELTRMATNLQQIRNVGKATSVDIKQFANAGINIFGLLSDYAQATGQDVEDLEYTYENITEAIKMSTEQGGRY